MKYILYIFFLLISVSFFAQGKSFADIENSTSPREIATFIKSNPNHNSVPELRNKLYKLVAAKNNIKAKPAVEPLTKSKLKKEIKKDVKDGVNDKNKEAANVLNHLFNNSPNKKEAYVQIVNQSKCNLIVKFNGKNDFYNLDVPAGNQNFVLIKKGDYIVTSKICDAKYTSAKRIHEDLSITLNANRKN